MPDDRNTAAVRRIILLAIVCLAVAMAGMVALGVALTRS